MIGYAKGNPAVFEILNRPGLGNAVARAVQEGVNAGNFNINLPASTILQYKLTPNDMTALQMFMQKNAQLQTNGRQLNRTPGEGSTSDYETKLLGSIYALPSDSPRAIVLKSEALILQSTFDEARHKLWVQKSKTPGYSYNDFMGDSEYKDLKESYRSTLDRVREENLDLLSSKPKAATTPPAAPAAPAAAEAKPAPPAAAENKPSPPAGETLSQRLKRLQSGNQ